MKVSIFGKTPESKAELKRAVLSAGFTYDEKKPNVVISYGGDGTFLHSERAYPGVPKALFRYSQICKKCHNLPIDHALELLKKKKYRIRENVTLVATVGKKKYVAVNDITIRNAEPTHAIRFRLTLDKKPLPSEFIGDGIVVATPHGSSGYYHSITRTSFEAGIGIAFNNTTVEQAPLLLSEGSSIALTLTRGHAHVVADNNTDVLTAKEGTTITIKVGKQKSSIIVF